MTPFEILGLTLLQLAILIFALVMLMRYNRRINSGGYGRDDGQADVQDPYAAVARDIFRDGGTIGFGKRTVPPVREPTVVLTPRMTERVNVQRKLRGKPPLNRDGFKNAAAHAWDQPRRQPDNSSDWLTYFILYECLLSDHQSHMCAGAGSLIIDPNLPYNGQGGEFAGAGASGSWDDPAVAAGAAIALGATYDLDRVPGIPGGDTSPTSAPDPTPSYSSSSDSSSSSSSYDSGSSSSSSDSGSSGGGGGD